MYVEQLHIENFRNLTTADLSFSPGFNYLFGPNGAGKTAVLEALYTLARGRSFRSHRWRSLIQQGEDAFLLRASVLADERTHRLALRKSLGGVTEMRVDGLVEARTSAIARHIPLQILLPDASGLIFQGPSVRRSFLDWGLFHVEPRFLSVARLYRRALMQRNAWLKKEAGVKRATFDQDPWREQLIAYGVQLGNFRAGYVDQLREPFADAIRRLAPSLAAELRYEWGGWDTAESAEKKLGESFARDVKLGVTHRGPHRSDLMVPVRADEVSKRSAIVQLPGEEVDNQRGGEGAEKDPEVAGEGEGLGSARMGIDAASTLSRGQAKLVASAAILAQATLQHQLTASRSMFLIDDFGAELDSEHWRLFLAALQSLSCQVIATSTSAPEHHLGWLEGSEARLFHVKQGRITRG